MGEGPRRPGRPGGVQLHDGQGPLTTTGRASAVRRAPEAGPLPGGPTCPPGNGTGRRPRWAQVSSRGATMRHACTTGAAHPRRARPGRLADRRRGGGAPGAGDCVRAPLRHERGDAHLSRRRPDRDVAFGRSRPGGPSVRRHAGGLHPGRRPAEGPQRGRRQGADPGRRRAQGPGHCQAPLPWIAEAGDTSFSEVVESSTIPVLVDFWAPWCGPCRTVSPVLEKLARQYAGRVKLVKVNVDEAPQISGRFDPGNPDAGRHAGRQGARPPDGSGSRSDAPGMAGGGAHPKRRHHDHRRVIGGSVRILPPPLPRSPPACRPGDPSVRWPRTTRG